MDVAWIPSLSSFFPRDNPGVGFGTRKALIPCNNKAIKYIMYMVTCGCGTSYINVHDCLKFGL